MAVRASWHLLTDNAPHCLRVQTWADKGVCRVVFITSAGTFLDTVAGEQTYNPRRYYRRRLIPFLARLR
jgi:hypothetical protein